MLKSTKKSTPKIQQSKALCIKRILEVVEYCKTLRLGRLNYLGLLCLLYLYIPVSLSLAMAKVGVSPSGINSTLSVLLTVFLLPYLLLALFRVQDTGLHRGFTVLAFFIPIIYVFWPGTKGSNRYYEGAKALPLIVKFLPLGVVLWFILGPYIMLATNA